MVENELDIQITPINAESFEEDSHSQPDLSHFDKLAEQRKIQRSILFWFAIISASIALFFLISLVITQIITKLMLGADFSILEGYELEILSVSVFGQIIGVIALITKSLWDENPFKDILKKDHEDKHNNGN